MTAKAAESGTKQCLMRENNASARALYILAHSFACKTTTDQIIGFVENVNTRRSIFLSLFEIESRPYEFNSLRTRGS